MTLGSRQAGGQASIVDSDVSDWLIGVKRILLKKPNFTDQNGRVKAFR